MLKRRPRCHGSDNVAHAHGRQRRGVGHVVVQEESQHPPATAAVPRQHVPPQRHAQQQPPAPCTLRRPLSRRAKENICQESTVPPTSRREPRSFAHAAPDELSSWGATMPWWTDTRDLRGGVQGTKRAIGGASRSELAMNNGPFPEKWPRTMAHSNQWAKEMGHFPKMALNNGLFLDVGRLASPMWRKPLEGFGRRAGSRSLNQAAQ